MKVTIITVAFNSAETIRDTIDSVRSQSHPDIEYIVIDGASTDATLAIIQENEDVITTYRSEPDKGLYDAMNKGIALATGDVIGILNSDDVYQDTEVISKVAEEFSNYPIDCVYGDLVYVDAAEMTKVKRYWRSGTYFRKAFLNGWMPPHPTFFTKRECYSVFGNYDVSFKTSADYELMLRFLYKNHCTASYLPHILVRMREGGQSNTSIENRIIGNKEDRLAWKKNNLIPRFYTLTMKPIRKLGQFFQRPGQDG
jgi:glycosyltransferase involved in cell wall biosynthesis